MKKMFQKIFKYNEWRYKKMFESFEKQENYQQFLIQNHQLFFNNVLGTMKHLLAADYIWYGRIMKLQSIEVPILIKDKILTIDLKELILLWQCDDDKIFDKLQFDYDQTKSLLLDINQVFQQLIDKCDDAFFDQEFEYQDSKGVMQKKDAQTVFYHLINHHTHHLGQISTAYIVNSNKSKYFIFEKIVIITKSGKFLLILYGQLLQCQFNQQKINFFLNNNLDHQLLLIMKWIKLVFGELNHITKMQDIEYKCHYSIKNFVIIYQNIKVKQATDMKQFTISVQFIILYKQPIKLLHFFSIDLC